MTDRPDSTGFKLTIPVYPTGTACYWCGGTGLVVAVYHMTGGTQSEWKICEICRGSGIRT